MNLPIIPKEVIVGTVITDKLKTVGELVAELLTYDQDMPVAVYDAEYGTEPWERIEVDVETVYDTTASCEETLYCKGCPHRHVKFCVIY